MTVKIKNRHRLKEKEVRELAGELQTRFQGVFLSENTIVDIGTIDEFTVLLVNDSIDLIMHDNKVVFTLQGIMKHQLKNKYVVIDMGAVSYITKGADVMAPGITDADPMIQKDDVVWVCDETHHKPLATGIALMNGEEMKKKQPGKAVKTLYYVGDRLWVLTH